MSKRVNIQTLQPVANGPVYGQKARTIDINNLQVFGREHVETLTKDFLTDEKSVVGFAYNLVGGNTRQIRILAPGRAYDIAGVQYDYSETVTLTFLASDSQPRIDLVVAKLDKDVPSLNESIPFARIRTQTELEQSVSPFVPTQYAVPTEIHNVVSVRIIKGTAASSPEPPSVASNEIILYQVSIPANSVSVISGNITDVRPLVRSIKYLTNLMAGLISPNGNGSKFFAEDGTFKILTSSHISDFNVAADARIAASALQPVSAKNQPNGYVGTDGNNFIDPARIPAFKSHEFVIVANQAARLALTAAQVQPGDEAFQSDTDETYKLIAADPSLLVSWKKIADITPDWSIIQNKPISFPNSTIVTNGNGSLFLADNGVYKIPIIAIGTIITNATPGSVFFAGADGALAQDNANLFFDNANNRLGIGKTNPLASLEVSAAINTNILRLSTTSPYNTADFSITNEGVLRIETSIGELLFAATTTVAAASNSNTFSGAISSFRVANHVEPQYGRVTAFDLTARNNNYGDQATARIATSLGWNGFHIGTMMLGVSAAADGVMTEVMRITGELKIGIRTTDPTAVFDVNSDVFRLRTNKSPASNAGGNQGDICADDTYLYRYCNGQWKRVAWATY